MHYLSTALYAEGPTDIYFLRPLLQRACSALCDRDANAPVEASDVLVLDDAVDSLGMPREERILHAAKEADGAWLILFVHADADSSPARALAERVEPARALLERHFGGSGRSTVAVVPVRSTDAWMLVDGDALRAAFGTRKSDDALGLAPLHAHGLERCPNPKLALQSVFDASRGQSRSRARSVSPYLGLLGERVSLDRLRSLPAYVRMEADLRDALHRLGFLR